MLLHNTAELLNKTTCKYNIRVSKNSIPSVNKYKMKYRITWLDL